MIRKERLLWLEKCLGATSEVVELSSESPRGHREVRAGGDANEGGGRIEVSERIPLLGSSWNSAASLTTV